MDKGTNGHTNSDVLDLGQRMRERAAVLGEKAVLDVYKNGANLIILNPKGEIYTQVANYGERKRMLPGGGIELSETPKAATARETHEESGLLLNPETFELCAVLSQRPYGLVMLYVLENYGENVRVESNEEVSSSAFMSISEIIARRDEFYLGYIRMIIHYLRWVHTQERRSVIEAVLAENVLVPEHLTPHMRQTLFI